MARTSRRPGASEQAFIRAGLRSYPQSLDVIERFQKIVLSAIREAFEAGLTGRNGKIWRQIDRIRMHEGIEGKDLYVGRYGDRSAFDVGLYWESNGEPGVWASVCVTDRAIADWLRKRLERVKGKHYEEEDNDYKYRFSRYEIVPGFSRKVLVNTLRKSIDWWPSDI